MPATRIILLRRISAPAAAVFDQLSHPDAVARWWGTTEQRLFSAEVVAVRGGPFQLVTVDAAGVSVEEDGRVTLVEPGALLIVEFAGSPIQSVTFQLRPTATGCELTMTHVPFADPAEREARRLRWEVQLDRLVEQAERRY